MIPWEGIPAGHARPKTFPEERSGLKLHPYPDTLVGTRTTLSRNGDQYSMRILDLGCGSGTPLTRWKLAPSDHVTAMDINAESLARAKQKYPERRFLEGSGENLPLDDQSFDKVICAISLPYMNIPKALREINRVLIPSGELLLSLHPPRFTLAELRNAFPRPKATTYRLFVLANGICFHFFGKAPGESFQTERGMRIALRRSGFFPRLFHLEDGPAGERFIVEALKATAVRQVQARAA
ncbi:MAG TPA: class I SAM-dependent methyltransferase [Terriglobales bacterium]|nr:class I SAM-dependent methyltransferase [Terriglobales bacterium]